MAEAAYVGTSGNRLLTASISMPRCRAPTPQAALRTGAQRDRAFEQRPFDLSWPAVESGKAIFGRALFLVRSLVEGDWQSEQWHGHCERQRPIPAGFAKRRRRSWIVQLRPQPAVCGQRSLGNPNGSRQNLRVRAARGCEQSGRRMAVERHLRGANRRAVQHPDVVRGCQCAGQQLPAQPAGKRRIAGGWGFHRQMVRYRRLRRTVSAGIWQRRAKHTSGSGDQYLRSCLARSFAWKNRNARGAFRYGPFFNALNHTASASR